MVTIYAYFLTLVLFLFFCVLGLYIKRFGTSFPLPPGPRGNLLFGATSILPSLEPWKVYADWSRRYNSSLISFRVYNRSVIVLNTFQAVQDLLEKCANLYSERPDSWMFYTVCARGKAIFNISTSDDRHKIYRKLIQSGLGVRATREYWPFLKQEVENLLQGFKDSPDKYQSHIHRNTAGVIMRVAFGYTVTADDPFIEVAEEAAKISSAALTPGKWLVDYYPALRYIPSFFPGSAWRRQGQIWKEELRHLSEIPHEWVKQQIRLGTHVESFTSKLLLPDGCNFVDAEEEDIIKWCAGGLYAGAGDTTSSAMISFVLLIALHPEVRQKLQTEIDGIIDRGTATVPHPEEIGKLLYMGAVLKEVLRYSPVANLALPHRVSLEDYYAGYRIPKDATVIANVWAIMNDETIYPNPREFKPERFLQDKGRMNQPDPKQFAFGFGKRTCPGIHFAETTMLLTMACIVSQFDVTLPADAPSPKIEFTTGITSHIKPFKIRITPRNNY